MTHRSWVGAVIGVVLLAGCSPSDGPEHDVSLPATGACVDALFWAATADGDLAITVFADLRGRSATGPTSTTFSVPDDGIEIAVLRGRDLARNFCTDLPDMGSRPTSTQGASAGTGGIRVDPPRLCGSMEGTLTAAQGELRIDGLVAEDGTTFAPVTVSSDHIGCYSG